MKYHTLYADPPWLEAGAGQTRRGADRHYPLMKTSAIANLEIDLENNGNFKYVRDLAPDDAHLYLWVTNNFLADGLTVMDAWGFRYVTAITWLKDAVKVDRAGRQHKAGLGQYYRGVTEHCLFGVRGNLPYRLREDGKRAQGETGFRAPRGRHSEKPEHMRRMIEAVSHPPYLEIFGRRQYPQWDVWGNEEPIGSQLVLA